MQTQNIIKKWESKKFKSDNYITSDSRGRWMQSGNDIISNF